MGTTLDGLRDRASCEECEAEHPEHDRELTELHAGVEAEERDHQAVAVRGEAEVTERAREAETVHEPEDGGDEPRTSAREGVGVGEGFARDEDHARRDGGLDRAGGQSHELERGEGERDGVREREGGQGADEGAEETSAIVRGRGGRGRSTRRFGGGVG